MGISNPSVKLNANFFFNCDRLLLLQTKENIEYNEIQFLEGFTCRLINWHNVNTIRNTTCDIYL